MDSRKQRMRLAGVAALAALALAATGCASSTPASSSGKPIKGGVASYYMISGTQPNWIFPFVTPTYFSIFNGANFESMMYRPLYFFGGNNDSVTVNYPLSPAKAPVYSDGGKTVVINLKGWKWSNGETVDADDVLFWLHMMSAEFANWGGAAPGGIPTNVTSMAVTGPLQLTLHLNKAYSSLWYTYNELSQLTPMPNAWDVTKLGAKAGSGGCLTDSAADHWAKCKAVYNFLSAQSKDTSTYATSPIWSVVDGPWKLKTFNTDGSDAFVPNPDYSGSPKPRIAEVKYITYTDDTAEYTGLKSGQVDVGVIPPQDLPVKTGSGALPTTNPLAADGYDLEPDYSFAFNSYGPNLNNTTYGALFKQLYFRQVLQYLVDQTGMAKTIYRGYGYPTTGAVPSEPVSKWIPAVQQGAGPYPFSISKAKALLASHGWSEVGGVMTCMDSAKCGAGVKKGLQLKLTFDYSSGTAVFTDEADIYKSDAAKAGIDLTVVAQAFNTILGDTPSNRAWQMAMAGGWIYGPDYEPTGEELFATGAGSNGDAYSSQEMNKLIAETQTSSSVSVFDSYATYAAKQLPVIYMPNSYNVQAVSKNLHGVTFNPLGAFLPEYWYFTKS